MKGAARKSATFFAVFSFATASVRVMLAFVMIFSSWICDSDVFTYA
jgi:hypothetical protein